MSSEDHFSRLKQMYLSARIHKEVYREVSIEIEPGKAVISHLAEPRFFHAAESLHGSVYFKLLDDAAFFAASSLEEVEFLFTVSFQVQLLRPIHETETITAEGFVVKPGKQIVIAQSVLFNSRGKKAGLGQGQFMKSGKLLADTKGYKI